MRSLRISSRPLRVREIPQRREEYSVEHSLDHLPAERVPRFTTRLSEQCTGCYNSCVPQVPSASAVLSGHSPSDGNRDRVTQVHPGLADSRVRIRSGQVAQVVERSPEKAGVGGSTPSLATILSITCTSRVSLFGCNWLQFPSELQLTIVPRLLNLLTTLCWLSGTNC